MDRTRANKIAEKICQEKGWFYRSSSLTEYKLDRYLIRISVLTMFVNKPIFIKGVCHTIEIDKQTEEILEIDREVIDKDNYLRMIVKEL